MRTKGTQLFCFTCIYVRVRHWGTCLGSDSYGKLGRGCGSSFLEASANLPGKFFCTYSFARNNQVRHNRHRGKGRRHEPCCFVLFKVTRKLFRVLRISRAPGVVTHEGSRRSSRGLPLASCVYYGDVQHCFIWPCVSLLYVSNRHCPVLSDF